MNYQQALAFAALSDALQAVVDYTVEELEADVRAAKEADALADARALFFGTLLGAFERYEFDDVNDFDAELFTVNNMITHRQLEGY